MLSNKLINELGILKLVPKQSTAVNTESKPKTDSVPVTKIEETTTNLKLDKHEFRLLVKMLQAINHDCQFDHIEYDGTTVKYQLPNKTLIFNDIDQADDSNTMNLASLSDIISNPALKRPVWEKLKSLKE